MSEEVGLTLQEAKKMVKDAEDEIMKILTTINTRVGSVKGVEFVADTGYQNIKIDVKL